MSEPLQLSEITAVILAGGFGTRVQHLLPNLPKPMAPVAGRPFLEWVVRFLAQQGVRRFVLSTGYLAETIHDHFRSAKRTQRSVRCVRELTPLGTAGGFLQAVRESGESAPAWLVLNGDSLVLTSLEPLARALDGGDIDGALVGLPVPDTSRYGSISRKADGTLERFAEKVPGRGWINGGVYLFRSSLLERFPDRVPLGFERDVFPALLEQGARFRIVAAEAPFLDIGTEETFRQAESFIQRHAHFFGEPENRPDAKEGPVREMGGVDLH